MNLVLDSEKDIRGKKISSHEKSEKIVKNWMEAENMKDIWRDRHPYEFKYTWKQDSYQLKERIDYIIMSTTLMNNVIEVDISPCFCSDHAIPWVTLSTKNNEKGPGLWKLNVDLLKNETFKEEVERVIDIAKRGNEENQTERWDKLKYEIKKIARKIAKEKSLDRKNLLQVLENKINFFEQEIINIENEAKKSFLNAQQIKKRIKELELEREKLVEYQAKGACIRARKNWMQYGEKNTRYFFKLEANNFCKKNRFEIENKKGEVIRGARNVLKEQDKFYSQLYRINSSIRIAEENLEEEFSNFCKDLVPRQISDNDRDYNDQEISLIELKKAVFEIKKGKVPGNDGIPIEFYQVFWDKIKFLLLEICQNISQND